MAQVTPSELTPAAAGAPARSAILVVDDEEAVATVLARGLTYAGFDVTVAFSGNEALECLAQRTFDACLTDICMPRLRGDELLRIVHERYPDLAVLLVTAASEVGGAVECMKDGASDFIAKPFILSDVVVRVGRALERRGLIRENRRYQNSLESQVQEQSEKLRKMLHGSLATLIFALEAKDPNTRNHSERVAALATRIAERLRPDDSRFHEQVRIGALFHDIGLIGIPEAILKQEGALSPEDAACVREHSGLGEAILSPLMESEVLGIVRGHHEHYNGDGYPDALAGDVIPLGARIVAVADAFDAMMSSRPYRLGRSQASVLATLRDGAGAQWDPLAIHALFSVITERGLAHPPTAESGDAEGESLPRNVASINALSLRHLAQGIGNVEQLMSAASDDTSAPETDSGASDRRLPGPGTPDPLQHVIFLKGELGDGDVRWLRDQVETLLARGERQIYLDLSQVTQIAEDFAHSMYALSLRVRKVNGSLIPRDAPRAVLAVCQRIGLARMMRFENTPLFGSNVATTPAATGSESRSADDREASASLAA